MNDKVSVIIFVPSRDESRRIAWDHCCRYWQSFGFEIVGCVADESDYWKSAVAHAGSAKASGDILIFADADCLVDRRALSDCIHAIKSGIADVGSPKTATQRLTGEESQMIYSGGIPGKPLGIKAYQAQDCGGVFVISRAFWERTGGMDLRFRGWGGEDGAYGCVCRVMGRVYRSEAVMYHLDHEPQPTKKDMAYSTKAENNALHIQYLDAEKSGNMAQFIEARPTVDVSNYEVVYD